MYIFKGCLSTESEGVFSTNSRVTIGGLERSLQKKHDSYALFEWGIDERKAAAVKPENLRLGYDYNCLCLDYHSANKTCSILTNGSLTMPEHWGALTSLLQTPLHMKFSGNDTPYSSEELTRVAEGIMKNREKDGSNVYKTPERIFEYVSPKDPRKKIIIRPVKEKKLVVHGMFDFSGLEGFEWVGKQEALFDSEKSNPLDFTSAKSIVMHDYYIEWVKKMGRNGYKSSLILRPEDMGENEVARHKLLDYLVAANVGGFFLAAIVEIMFAGHDVHLEAMQKFAREEKLADLE